MHILFSIYYTKIQNLKVFPGQKSKIAVLMNNPTNNPLRQSVKNAKINFGYWGYNVQRIKI